MAYVKYLNNTFYKQLIINTKNNNKRKQTITSESKYFVTELPFPSVLGLQCQVKVAW